MIRTRMNGPVAHTRPRFRDDRSGIPRLYHREHNPMNSGQKTDPNEKKSYKTPSLVTYGRLKDLTTGGTSGNKESSKNQLTRKP